MFLKVCLYSAVTVALWVNCRFLNSIGSIIRCMRRLEELLRQMCQAAKAIGNTDLENKFAAGTCTHNDAVQ